MKKKQVWSMILAAAVGAGMLAGCGSGQTGNESPAETAGEKDTTAAESNKSETEGGWVGTNRFCGCAGGCKNCNQRCISR